MERSPSWEIPNLFRNPKVHYRVHKSQLVVPIMSHMNPILTFPPNFPDIHSNIFFSSTPRSFTWFLHFRFSYQIFVCVFNLSHACCIPCPSHPPWLAHQIIFCEAYTLWTSSLCSLLQPPATSSLLGPNILLSTLFSNTLNLCSSSLWCQRPSFTPIQNNRWNYDFRIF